MLSIYDISIYETGVVPIIVPGTVPRERSEWVANCHDFAV
jgi:hypothetical protein